MISDAQERDLVAVAMRTTRRLLADSVEAIGGIAVAAGVCEYATLTSPSASVLVEMDGGAPIVIASALVAEAPRLSVTFRVKFVVPAVVGVPVIAPVVALRLSPAGSGPGDSDQV